MDGVIGEGSLRQATPALIDHLLGDDELRATWTRYHLIGDALRSATPAYDPALTEAIRRRLDDEPSILAPHALRKRPAAKTRQHSWVAGAAIAASVSALVVVGVSRYEQTGGTLDVAGVAPEVLNEQPRENSALALVSETGTAARSQEPEVSSKLDRYLVNHSDFAGGGSLNGMVPLATFISYHE